MATWRGEQILELAISSIKQNDFERAAHLCVGAIRVKPDFAEAFGIRGVCLLRQQRPFDALLHFDRSIDLKPDQYDAWNNRGIAFTEVGMWESAEASYRQSLMLMRAPDPHIMLGGMYAHLMRLKDSEREFRAAIEIDPTLHDPHIKLGVVLMGQGRWAEGFPEYGVRWLDTPYPPRPYRSFPKWQGEDLTGKTILLYSEQGYGDEIMALRFVEAIWKRNPARVVVEVRPTVTRLALTLVCEGEIIDVGDPYTGQIDYSSPLLDVPMVMGMTPDTMPSPFAYLFPPSPINGMGWGQRMEAELPKGRLNVGLCWNSGRRPLQPETEKSAAAKSLQLAQLKEIVGIEGVNFISLQIPREPIPHDMRIHDWTAHIDDLGNTAEMIVNLDLVITVDTAVAHLAGALGVPCWNLVRFNGYWPWMEPRPVEAGEIGEKTPWYPSMRLFRQPELGDWAPALERVRDRLLDLTAKRVAA